MRLALAVSSALESCAERKSRLYLALPITNKTAQVTNDAINKLFILLKHWVKILAFDNA